MDAELGTKAIVHAKLGRLHLQSIPTSHPDLRLTQDMPAGAATRSVRAGA